MNTHQRLLFITTTLTKIICWLVMCRAHENPTRTRKKILNPIWPKTKKKEEVCKTLFETNPSSKLIRKNFKTQSPQLATWPITNVGLVFGNTRKVFGNSTNSDKQQSITNYWKNLLCNKTLMVGGLIKRETNSQKIPITIFGKNEILGM